MHSNMLAARAQVAERRERYEAQAAIQRLRREDRRPRPDRLRSSRRDRDSWFRLRARAA
jgi:hypothetical protein